MALKGWIDGEFYIPGAGGPPVKALPEDSLRLPPADMTGKALYLVRVKATENGLEYVLAGVPYSGATGDLDMGTYGVIADRFKMNTSPSVTPAVGDIYWDSTEGVPAVMLSASTTMMIGTEFYVRAVNKTGVQIDDGAVVYISGAQGNRPTITLAQANSITTSSIIGVVTANIADNAEGFVTIVGDVHSYNTAGFSAGGLSIGQSPFKKNTAFTNFMFVMYDSTNHAPVTGKTVTATRSIDGATYAACANSVSEVANGLYKIDLAAADLNGANINLRFTATSADDVNITLPTLV